LKSLGRSTSFAIVSWVECVLFAVVAPAYALASFGGQAVRLLSFYGRSTSFAIVSWVECVLFAVVAPAYALASFGGQAVRLLSFYGRSTSFAKVSWVEECIICRCSSRLRSGELRRAGS